MSTKRFRLANARYLRQQHAALDWHMDRRSEALIELARHDLAIDRLRRELEPIIPPPTGPLIA